MKKNNINGFTLVELIVVITILAILGTIAFISLQGYSQSARDSKRVSDIGNIKTSLALFNTRTGRYPEPDGGVDITYDGINVWKQGIIGENVTKNLHELGTTPLDPLYKKEYTYSLLSTKDEYEIGSIMENEQIGIVKNTFAEEKKYFTLITGNYNGKVAKAYTGSDIYVFGIPSIIGSDLSNTDLIEIINKKSLSFNGFQNIPDNFKGPNISMTGSFEFGGENFDILIYSGSLELLSSSGTLLENFGDRIQEIYGLSVLANSNNYKEIINLDTSDSNEIKNIIGNIVNNNLGGKVTNVSDNNSTTCKFNSLELNNLNNFFGDYGYDGDEEFWCTLTDLEVNGEKINGNAPKEIGKLTALENLDLGDNNFSINNINFSKLINLYYLDLSKLNLTSIPSSIINLTSLSELYLNNNNISIIDNNIGNLNNLTTLYLNNNQIYILPDNITNLDKLYNLNLSGNNFLGNLSNDFSNNSNIKTEKNITTLNKNISIEGDGNYIVINSSNQETCSLNSTETETLNTYFSGKGYNGNESYWCSLTTINLSNQELTETLPEEIGKLKQLTNINLKNTQITKLPDNLSLLYNLTNLDLSENDDLGDLNYNFTKDYIGEDKVGVSITPTLKNMGIVGNKRYIKISLYTPR